MAGLLLLVFYNFIAPLWGLRNDFLGDIVYHLLNISFISMLLRVTGKEPRGARGSGSSPRMSLPSWPSTGRSASSARGYRAHDRNLRTRPLPRHRVHPPLGFELGPGQAYSIALGWEKMGFRGASSVGLTMVAIGFLVGSFGGVVLINQGLKRGWITADQAKRINAKSVRSGFFSRQESERPIGAYLSTDGESLYSVTYHTALVMATYLLSWALLSALTLALGLIGPLGVDLAESLWGINFIFSAFCALAVKLFMRSVGVETTIDNGTLNRINGFSVDITVASSLGAISLVTVQGYWVPILVLVLVGSVITDFILPWYCSRLYSDHQFFRMLVIYGTATGTLPTGLALLRVVDAEFETPVATDYLYSVGIVFVLAIPIILSVNLPAFSVTHNNPALFGLAIAISAFYLVASFVAYLILTKKRAFADSGTLFYTE